MIPHFLPVKIWSRVFQSCLFLPCDLVPRFPVPRFPPPYFSWSPVFHSRVFSVPILTQVFEWSCSGRISVGWESNGAGIADESKSNRSCNHRIMHYCALLCNQFTDARLTATTAPKRSDAAQTYYANKLCGRPPQYAPAPAS